MIYPSIVVTAEHFGAAIWEVLDQEVVLVKMIHSARGAHGIENAIQEAQALGKIMAEAAGPDMRCRRTA